MRVLIAPDKFAGTLSAVAAAEAIASGWRRASPRDELDTAPMADGGPGFLDVLRAATGADGREVTVTGPLGQELAATVARHGDTAYVEAAQACGLAAVPEGRRDPITTTTYGVGELIVAALASEPHACVVGLGGSATNDGGAGMLAALGAHPAETLRCGGGALAGLGGVDLGPARRRLGDCALVAATDVESPLLGPGGASAVFGPQKGASDEQVARLESALRHWAALTDRDVAEPSGRPGAGAAGGLGHGLFLLGARRESGIDAVLGASGLAERVAAADLVVTGEGSFDTQSLHGKVVSGVARVAARQRVPCLVLAGSVAVPAAQLDAAGIRGAYAVADSAGSRRAAMLRPAAELAALAERCAREWTP